MAVLKFVSKGYTNSDAVSKVFNYITDCNKAYGSAFGYNLLPEFTVEEFIYAKTLYAKTDGQQLIHFILSLADNEKLSEEYMVMLSWGISYFFQNFQVTFCVHSEQEHLHTHFMVNTVSFVDGSRLVQNEELKNDLLNYCRSISPINIEGV